MTKREKQIVAKLLGGMGRGIPKTKSDAMMAQRKAASLNAAKARTAKARTAKAAREAQ
jgi:hypothetical protein